MDYTLSCFAHTACGERGIRTPGTRNYVRQFSKLVVSATHPPHRLCHQDPAFQQGLLHALQAMAKVGQRLAQSTAWKEKIHHALSVMLIGRRSEITLAA